MNKLSPQNQVVLNHLQKVGHITNVEAQAVHKLRSISSRIAELNRLGYNIVKTRKYDVTGQWYIEYTLAPTVFPYPHGTRVRVVVDHIRGDAARRGAEGVVIGSEDCFGRVIQRVRFDKGDFNNHDGLWYVRAEEVVAV